MDKDDWVCAGGVQQESRARHSSLDGTKLCCWTSCHARHHVMLHASYLGEGGVAAQPLVAPGRSGMHAWGE